MGADDKNPDLQGGTGDNKGGFESIEDERKRSRQTDNNKSVILKGNKVRLMFEVDGHSWDTMLSERDLISVPAGVYRGLVNEGQEETLMCVMLGAAMPVTPTYPPDHPVSKIKR